MSLIPTCPTDCAGALPTVSFDNCQPEINSGNISKIYVGKDGDTDMADWTAVGEWSTRLSQDAATADAIRALTVVADKPAAEEVLRQLSDDREEVVRKNHTINFRIDETNADNHEAMRLLECGGKFKVWYETLDGLLFGGNAGVPAKISINMVIPESEDDIIRYEGVIRWKSRYHTERTASPIS